jgi:HicB family
MATPEAAEGAPPEESRVKPARRTGKHSGRLLLRMPAELHEELARTADASGISLNQFITNALAGAVGWGRDDKVARTAKRHPRALTILLALNLVLVAAAAAAAVTFLIAAWMS